MWVIKLGGSLYKTGMIRSCLDTIVNKFHDKKVVLVPGGGCFADFVRNVQSKWHVDDRAAHQMAILAMQQMAILTQTLRPFFAMATKVEGVLHQLEANDVVIWSPDLIELDAAAIGSSWTITSDSLSAWLAESLSAEELILIKSANIAQPFDVEELAQRGIVDAALPDFVAQSTYKLSIVNVQNFIK